MTEENELAFASHLFGAEQNAIERGTVKINGQTWQTYDFLGNQLIVYTTGAIFPSLRGALVIPCPHCGKPIMTTEIRTPKELYRMTLNEKPNYDGHVYCEETVSDGT